MLGVIVSRLDFLSCRERRAIRKPNCYGSIILVFKMNLDAIIAIQTFGSWRTGIEQRRLLRNKNFHAARGGDTKPEFAAGAPLLCPVRVRQRVVQAEERKTLDTDVNGIGNGVSSSRIEIRRASIAIEAGVEHVLQWKWNKARITIANDAGVDRARMLFEPTHHCGDISIWLCCSAPFLDQKVVHVKNAVAMQDIADCVDAPYLVAIG